MMKLYVGNLSYQTNDETLRAVFEEDGREVLKVAIITDRETGQSRGFAFVEMGSPAEGQAAIEACDGRDVDGRRLRVSEAREREPRRGPGGGGGGGRGGGGFGGGGGGGRDRDGGGDFGGGGGGGRDRRGRRGGGRGGDGGGGRW